MNYSREYAQFTNDADGASSDRNSPLPALAGLGPSGLAPGHGTAKLLASLIAVLRAEAAMLSRQEATVDASLTRQKLQLMMQLGRIDLKREKMNDNTRQSLLEARRLLDSNARILKRRMSAIREIAGMISQEINEAQSDGTYEVSVASRAYSAF